MEKLLKVTGAAQFLCQGRAVNAVVDSNTLVAANQIVNAVRDGGDVAIRKYAEQFGEREPGQHIVLGPEELKAAFDRLPDSDNQVADHQHHNRRHHRQPGRF